MYSPKLESLFRRKGIEVGDVIKVTKGKKVYEGILMPRIKLGDRNCLVIKLPNGYNVGIRYEKGVKVQRIKKGKPIKFVPARARLRKRTGLPTVSILGAGGTIASRVEYRTGAVFPAFSPADLLLSFPELEEIANIKARRLFDLYSEDITPCHWQLIAKEVAKEVRKGVDGVVLMHGTDTMHYTSAALSFMLQSLPVPVVLVGAQRSSDRGSSDNLVNLVCATLSAGHSTLAEVMICMHGSMSDEFCYLHQGTKVRKLHTSRRDTFRSINVLPFAKVFYSDRKIEYLRKDFKVRDKKRKLKIDTRINPNVTLVYFHPGLKPEYVRSLAKFYDGIVIAGTGLGHVSTNPLKDRWAHSLLPALKELIGSGIPVVMAPQTLYGRLQMDVYEAGRLLNEIGVIGHGCDWLPEVALVKLMWVLGRTRKMERIKEEMLTNVAGEISSVSDPRAFLF